MPHNAVHTVYVPVPPGRDADIGLVTREKEYGKKCARHHQWLPGAFVRRPGSRKPLAREPQCAADTCLRIGMSPKLLRQRTTDAS